MVHQRKGNILKFKFENEYKSEKEIGKKVIFSLFFSNVHNSVKRYLRICNLVYV